jgi:hypothetical protein
MASHSVVPDEVAPIHAPRVWQIQKRCVDLIVTTGGTGPAPRDVTLEATRTVIERELLPAIVALIKGEAPADGINDPCWGLSHQEHRNPDGVVEARRREARCSALLSSK